MFVPRHFSQASYFQPLCTLHLVPFDSSARLSSRPPRAIQTPLALRRQTDKKYCILLDEIAAILYEIKKKKHTENVKAKEGYGEGRKRFCLGPRWWTHQTALALSDIHVNHREQIVSIVVYRSQMCAAWLKKEEKKKMLLWIPVYVDVYMLNSGWGWGCL